MDRATLLARAMFAINSLDTDVLVVEVARLEQIAPLCLAVEPAEHEEDGGPGGLLSRAPEASDL
jgi:hypothetical protein